MLSVIFQYFVSTMTESVKELAKADSAGKLWTMIQTRLSKLWVSAPVLGELLLLLVLIFVSRAIIYRKERLKHSALLVQGQYAVHPGRERPREHNKKKFFQNQHGLWIHHCMWHDEKNTSPKGLILYLHGHSEHVNRHAHVAEDLVEAGYIVFGMDHQGFGRSEGDRGHVETFDHYIDDVMEFFTQVLKEDYNKYQHLPRFLMAHSMGSCIALTAALKMQDSPEPWHKLTGVVAGSPAVHVDVPPALLAALNVLAYLFPKSHIFDFPGAPSTTFLQIKHHSQYDPLNFQDKLRPHHTMELMKAQQKLIEQADKFTTPVLIFHGDADDTTNILGSRNFISRISSKDKYLHELPGFKHEPMQDEKHVREPLFNFVKAWLDERAH